MKLKGKAAIVTGANSGIGAAIARAFAAHGVNLLIAARRSEENERVAAELSQQYGTRVMSHAADLSFEENCIDLVRGAAEQFGRLDILINNAGQSGDGKRIADSTTEALERVLRINLYSAFWCSREAFKLMSGNEVESDSAIRGAILNTASVCGIDAWAESGLYSISKHALMALSKTMSDEGAEPRIRVAAICPALVSTPMTGVSGPDYIDPDDIAQTALYLLGLSAAAWPTEVVVRRRGAD